MLVNKEQPVIAGESLQSQAKQGQGDQKICKQKKEKARIRFGTFCYKIEEAILSQLLFNLHFPSVCKNSSLFPLSTICDHYQGQRHNLKIFVCADVISPTVSSIVAHFADILM